MSWHTARILWWVGAVVLAVGVYVGLDRLPWSDGLSELAQSGTRIACGMVIFTLAGALDPWRKREE